MTELKGQLEQLYKNGYKQGVINTCAVLYAAMQIGGVEKENPLYPILIDIAKHQGCDNLVEVACNLKS